MDLKDDILYFDLYHYSTNSETIQNILLIILFASKIAFHLLVLWFPDIFDNRQVIHGLNILQDVDIFCIDMPDRE
jgi:hypothetical protein